VRDLPERDPLADLVSRSVGARIASVAVEELPSPPGIERRRLRYETADGPKTAIFERSARGATLEAQLLPFLARKTPHVPVVHARGIPPPMVAAPQWILVEDLEDAPSACDRDPTAIVDALVAVDTAVVGDAPALRALGVTARSPADVAGEIVDAVRGEGDADTIGAEAAEAAQRLRGWPAALAHGDLRCENAVVSERGVVLRGWGRAHMGCALLDVVRLVADMVERGDAVRGIGLTRTYAERIGVVLPTDQLRAAEKLDRLSRRYLRRT
jgi:phosphotransferase family enzyme